MISIGKIKNKFSEGEKALIDLAQLLVWLHEWGTTAFWSLVALYTIVMATHIESKNPETKKPKHAFLHRNSESRTTPQDTEDPTPS